MSGDVSDTTTRGRTAKARIIEYLNAGWTDLGAMWTAIEREYPHIHLSWNYIRKVHRDWKAATDVR